MGFGSLSTNPPAFLGCLQKLWELKLSKVPTLWCWFVPTTKFLSAQTNALAVNKGRQLVSLFQPHHPWKLMKVQRWEKYPISSPTLFSWKKPKTREGLIQHRTPGIRCGSFLLKFMASSNTWIISWAAEVYTSASHSVGRPNTSSITCAAQDFSRSKYGHDMHLGSATLLPQNLANGIHGYCIYLYKKEGKPCEFCKPKLMSTWYQLNWK